jgi:hypothetical protein
VEACAELEPAMIRTYKEISQFDVFCDVHLDTLRDIYRWMKAKGKRQKARGKK